MGGPVWLNSSNTSKSGSDLRNLISLSVSWGHFQTSGSLHSSGYRPYPYKGTGVVSAMGLGAPGLGRGRESTIHGTENPSHL